MHTHPARYALVEINNLYDEGIEFEPIHRVLFHVPDPLPAAREYFKEGYEVAPAASFEEMKERVDEAARRASSNHGSHHPSSQRYRSHSRPSGPFESFVLTHPPPTPHPDLLSRGNYSLVHRANASLGGQSMIRTHTPTYALSTRLSSGYCRFLTLLRAHDRPPLPPPPFIPGAPAPHVVGLCTPSGFHVLTLPHGGAHLPVGALQPFLDQFMARAREANPHAEIDYIHGDEVRIHARYLLCAREGREDVGRGT